MKIKISILYLLLSIQVGFSQKTIVNPEYETNFMPGKITKIEIKDDISILHFHLKLRPNRKFSVSNKAHIQSVANDEKLFVTKAKGIEIGKKTSIDSTGVIKYALYFPGLDKQIGKIDFVETTKGRHWYVNDIVIDTVKYGSILPKALKGNWLKTDGSNLWEYGFYNNKAIINKQVWSYKSIKSKKRKFEITLENAKTTKVIYAKLNKDETVNFGNSKNKLSKYSLKRTENKNFILENDTPYTENTLFKIDSATYSGVLRNFSHRNKQKTGTISVDNIFTGNQESYLININDDGSFSVEFPLVYPQEIFVKLPDYYGAVFVEPGKETWQLINSSSRKDVFFAGDLAELNSGLVSLESIFNRNAYYKLLKNVKTISLKDFKKACTKLQEERMAKYDSIIKTRFISKKLNQVMRLKLEYGFYEKLLSYDVYNREKKEPKIDSAYLSFLTPNILENKLGVIANEYSTFINRLRFSEPYDNRKELSVKYPYGLDLVKMLKARGVTITNEEQAFFDEQIKFNEENATVLKKEEDFRKKHKILLNSFNKKMGQLYTKLSKEKRKDIFSSKGFNVDSIVKIAKTLNINFSKEEIEIQNERLNLKTAKENEIFRAFYTKERNEKNTAFTQKYYAAIREHVQEEMNRKGIEKTLELFKDKKSWLSDLFIMQKVSASLVEQMSPLSNKELDKMLTYLTNPFVKEFLVYENERSLAKIEANKSATDYVANEIPNIEADKVFNDIVKKYKGKVVFIDFWATWCGPCRDGMKKMKPMKAELKGEDVVFVYITNPTSPLKTYNNMIPQIKGQHYRVSQDQWNYLKQKFNITGIPHYTLVDKEGKVIKKKIRFSSSAHQFKKIIEEQL